MGAQEKTIYTIGYGNRQPKELVKLLKNNGVGIVADVRRQGSRAWLHEYWQGYENIGRLFSGSSIFHHEPLLGNYYEDLSDYTKWLDSCEGRGHLSRWVDVLEKTTRRCCLLCAEKDNTRCHRTIVADRLAKRLGILDGYEWSVVHL